MNILRVPLVLFLVLTACTVTEDAPTAPPAGPPQEATVPSTVTGSSDVFGAVASALSLVETPLTRGSGILISDQYVVTNAHVVWPYRSVDVSFVEGAHARSVPVTAVDWVADLALIDVSGIDHLPVAAELDRFPYSPGDPVRLMGFLADDTGTPLPATTPGTISRTRTWDDADLRFIQSTAVISGGQSGGALVNESGSVIGIGSLQVDNGFTLALSGSDLIDRITDMAAGGDPFGLGSRWVDDLGVPGSRDPSAHDLDEAVWILEGVPGETVLVEVTAPEPRSGSIIGPDGFLEATFEDGKAEFTVDLPGPHFVAVVPPSRLESPFELNSTVELTPMNDPDHGRTLDVGSVTFGNIDYPGDLDWFTIELPEGASIVITASSPNADMALYVGPSSDLRGSEARSDSGSGAGVIGSDAEVRYTAASPGTHVIGVFDETQFGPGAYALRVEED